MIKKHVHKRREIILPSFPNNKLSTRPRKKKVEKREIIEDDLTIYPRIPDTAISTPYDQPNPTDHTPSFSQTMNYSDAGIYSPASADPFRAWEQGVGCDPAEEWKGGGCVQHGGVLNSAQPISGTEIGHTCGIDDSQGVRVCGDFVEIPQVASQCSRENAKLFGDRRNCQIPTYWRAPLITSYAEITVELYDPAPTGILLNVGNGFSISNIPTQSEGGYHHYNFAMPLDHPSMYIWGYEVNVTVWDSTNHYSYLEIEVDGLFSGVIDFLEGIWNGLCGAFSAAANAVAAAVNLLWMMIEEMINGLLDTVLTPIVNAISTWINSLLSIIQSSFTCNSPISVVGEAADIAKTLVDFITLPLIAIAIACNALMVIEAAVGVAALGSTTVLAALSSELVVYSILATIGTMFMITGGLMAASSSMDIIFNAMGDAAGLFEYEAAVLGLLVIVAESLAAKAIVVRALSFSLASLFLITMSNLEVVPDWVAWIFDIFALILAFIGMSQAWKEAALTTVLFPIMGAVTKGMAIVALITAPLKILSHFKVG